MHKTVGIKPLLHSLKNPLIQLIIPEFKIGEISPTTLYNIKRKNINELINRAKYAKESTQSSKSPPNQVKALYLIKMPTGDIPRLLKDFHSQTSYDDIRLYEVIIQSVEKEGYDYGISIRRKRLNEFGVTKRKRIKSQTTKPFDMVHFLYKWCSKVRHYRPINPLFDAYHAAFVYFNHNTKPFHNMKLFQRHRANIRKYLKLPKIKDVPPPSKRCTDVLPTIKEMTQSETQTETNINRKQLRKHHDAKEMWCKVNVNNRNLCNESIGAMNSNSNSNNNNRRFQSDNNWCSRARAQRRERL